MCGENRRGVLLLVVLSMLTLFLLLGAAYIAVARRARMTSRAFANNITATAAAGVAERKLVDDAFLTIVRGTKNNLPDGSPEERLGSGDDLLGDKYGHASAIEGKATAVTVSGTEAILELATSELTPLASSSAPTSSSDLNGRVLTFVMPGLNVSTRILLATGSATSPTITVAAGPTVAGPDLSRTKIQNGIDASAGKVNIIINGREFSGDPNSNDTNEPYDGLTDKDPLLTQIIPVEDGGNESVQVTKAPINGNADLEIDNDGDGEPDSNWLDIGLPPIIGPNGKEIFPKAAVLVTDLDGRLNINVHGSAVEGDLFDDGGDEVYPDVGPPPGSPAVGAVTQYHLPRGASVGPASISMTRSCLFGEETTAKALADNALKTVSGVNQISEESVTTGDQSSGREVPLIETEGRYGGPIKAPSAGDEDYCDEAPRPGVHHVNDNGLTNQSADRWRAGLVQGLGTWKADDYFTNPGRYGSPFDFKGRLRVWADPVSGQPVFYKPYWDETSRDLPADNELIDDPYEVNIAQPSASDNLFTAGDLEGLLRYFDSDSMKLKRRLVTLLGTTSETNRLSVTTDSWDTPAVVGTAWKDVIGDVFDDVSSFAPETKMGLKLDLNRPFHKAPNFSEPNDDPKDIERHFSEPNDTTGIERRQLFAKQVYCLMIAIAEANGATLNDSLREQIAQYAINIVDFRDADSVMTPFDYDPSFGQGSGLWSTANTKRVWGCERPELIITETFAGHDRRTTYNTGNQAFEQKDRPEGVFFVEIASPWNSKAYEFDGSNAAVAKTVDVAGSPEPVELRGKRLPDGLMPYDDPDDPSDDQHPERATSRIDLEKKVGADPVWRLVSVKGIVGGNENAFGEDPVLSATHPGDKWMLDLDPSGTDGPTPDRYFYFAKPYDDSVDPNAAGVQLPHGIEPAKRTAIFWQQKHGDGNYGDGSTRSGDSGGFDPGPDGYGVAGTPRLFPGTSRADDPFDNVVDTALFRGFKGSQGQYGTLTEPLLDASNGTIPDYDPYQQLSQNGSYAPGSDPIITLSDPTDRNYGTWSNPLNSAIDSLQTDEPLLVTNGTHANYAVIHLQRLANPTQPWSEDNNPYLTIDCMPVDLTVVNKDGGVGSSRDDPVGSNAGNQLAYRADSIQRGGTVSRENFDIWNRSPKDLPDPTDPNATPINLMDDDTFRLPDTSERPEGNRNPPYSHDFWKEPVAREQNKPLPWLAFFNRPFTSAAELSLVPIASPFHLTQRHSPATDLLGEASRLHHLAGFFESSTPVPPWDAITGRSGTGHSLLDMVHVPSPYRGLRRSIPMSSANESALQDQLGLDVLPLEQLSTFREPGRVNVNTISDSKVWRALFGDVKAQGDPDAPDSDVQLPAWPQFSTEIFGRGAGQSGGSDSENAAKSRTEFFKSLPSRGSPNRQSRQGGFRDEFTLTSDAHRNTDLHAYFRYQTRMQLQNLVTVRSNVYAIWVTVGYFDSDGDEIDSS